MSNSGPVQNSSWSRNGYFQDAPPKLSDIDVIEQGIQAGVQAVLQVSNVLMSHLRHFPNTVSISSLFLFFVVIMTWYYMAP